MSITVNIFKKVESGETVFLENEFEKVAVKMFPGGAKVKLKGKTEFPATHGSVLVADVTLDPATKFITEQEYNKF